jgi:Tfp pilus assembly protein PilF
LSPTIRALDDASAAAHLLSLRAQSAMRRAPAKGSAEAYELSRLALAASAPSATLQLARAFVLAGAGGEQDALAAARHAAQMKADAPRRTALARLLVSLGEPAEGRGALQAAVQQDPRFFPALVGLAQLAWLTGKRDEGDARLRAAQEIAPDDETVLAAGASRLIVDGKLDEGLAMLERAAAAGPESEPVHLSLYATLARAGRAERAKTVRARLLEIAADQDEIKRALDALDRAAAQVAAQVAAASQPAAAATNAPVPPPPPPLPPRRELKLPDVSLGHP